MASIKVISDKTEADLVDEEYRRYAMYTLESRAIPSVIDGLKPVQRKILYMAINEAQNKKVKVADFGSISKYGYRHGEAAAQAAAVGMASTRGNNAPLLEGFGDFGSRLSHSSAAPRYIFAKLSENFHKYFDSHEILPPSSDTDAVEPEYYLPKIPFILVNGVEGIAVGFATKILPRSIEDVVAATVCRLDGFELSGIKPTFPGFKGYVEADLENHKKWHVFGRLEFKSKTTWMITELPPNWDRERYVSHLTDLVNADTIANFSDLCGEDGFKFEIKLSRNQHQTLSKKSTSDLTKIFKLRTTYTENFTVLDEHGKLKIFDSISDLIDYFILFRRVQYMNWQSYELARISKLATYYTAFDEFRSAVLDGSINLLKMSRDDLQTHLTNWFTELSPDDVQKLMNIKVSDLTNDQRKPITEKLKELWAKKAKTKANQKDPNWYRDEILQGLK